MSDQSTGRDIEASWIETVSTPPQYLPKVDAPPMGNFEDFLEYARTVLIPWTLGIALGAVLMLVFLMGFNPLGK